MYINEQTAQLILDAIYWCNQDWVDAQGYDFTTEQMVEQAREDFVKFCEARGIEGVEKEVEQ